MLVTPSTSNVHWGNTVRSVAGKKGRTHPPMQASTWQRTPAAAAAEASAGIGSTTPWA